MTPISEISKQVLSEASFARFVNYHTPKGFIAISACCGAKVLFDKDVITDAEVKQVKAINRGQTEALRRELSARGVTFFPVFGTFQEKVLNPDDPTADPLVEEVDEASFLVFPRRDQGLSDKEVGTQLMVMGKELARKYTQQSFLFKPPGAHTRAYYITPRGQVDMGFDGIRLNDLSQDYATRFVNHPPSEKTFSDKADRRFSYTNSTPNLGWKDEGEVLTAQEKKRAAAKSAGPQDEVLREELALLASFDETRNDPPVVAAEAGPLLQEQYRARAAASAEPVRWMNASPDSVGAALQRYGEVFLR